MPPSFLIRTHVSQSWRLMPPFTAHLFVTAVFMPAVSLRRITMADYTRKHLQATLQGGGSTRECPGNVLRNVDADVSLYSQSGIRTFNKSKGRDGRRREEAEEERENGGEAGNVLFKHSSPDFIMSDVIRV